MGSNPIGSFLRWLLPEPVAGWIYSHLRTIPQDEGDRYVSGDVGPPPKGDTAALNRQAAQFGTQLPIGETHSAGASAPGPKSLDRWLGPLERWPEYISSLQGSAIQFALDVGRVFIEKQNPARSDLFSPFSDIDTFPLTKAIFDRLLVYRQESTGKVRSDIVVGIPGYRSNLVEVTNWLSLGVKVVAVESRWNAFLLRVNALFSTILLKALVSGRLIIREIGDEIPEVDIVVWTRPPPAIEISRQQGLYVPFTHEDMVANLVNDGIVVMETETGRFVDEFKGDPNFRMLMPPTETTRGSLSYLLPSQIPGHSLSAAIYQRNPGPNGESAVNGEGGPSSGPADAGSRGEGGESPPFGGIYKATEVPSNWGIEAVSSPGYEPGLSVVESAAVFAMWSGVSSFTSLSPIPAFIPITPVIGVLVK